MEIYSCLNKWLNDNVYKRNRYPKNLKIFADNCGGQNKNNNMCLALLMNIHKKKFDRIELGFLVPGHSYSACDRKFGTIESHYRKNECILSTEEYEKNIRIALNKNDHVVHMKRENFLNIEVFLSKENSANRLAYIRPTTGKIFQKATQIVMSKNYMQGYILKDSFDASDDEGTKISVIPPHTEEADFDLSEVVLMPKYSHDRRLDKKKLKDLRHLTKYMPDHKEWVLRLINTQNRLYSHNIEDEDSDDMSDCPESDADNHDSGPEDPPPPTDIDITDDTVDRLKERVRVRRII